VIEWCGWLGHMDLYVYLGHRVVGAFDAFRVRLAAVAGKSTSRKQKCRDMVIEKRLRQKDIHQYMFS
jgi:hypothetical protein